MGWGGWVALGFGTELYRKCAASAWFGLERGQHLVLLNGQGKQLSPRTLEVVLLRKGGTLTVSGL